jgi:hypothetical protein
MTDTNKPLTYQELLFLLAEYQAFMNAEIQDVDKESFAAWMTECNELEARVTAAVSAVETGLEVPIVKDNT